MGKKFSEAVLTWHLKKSVVLFLIFLKADKHQFNSASCSTVIFNHDFDLYADIPVDTRTRSLRIYPGKQL